MKEENISSFETSPLTLTHTSLPSAQVMLAGRDIGLFVGMLTMGATWVGGGFINGSAQETYSAGLIWTQAPFGYACSLFISEYKRIKC